MAEMLTKICHALCLLVIAANILILATVNIESTEPREPTQQATSATVTEEATKPTQSPTEPTQPTTTETAPPETTTATEPPVTLYDIPFSEDLQIFTASIAMEYGIDPAIVFALIWRESNFDPKAVGDNGDSHGLMQIQPKWCGELMEQLGHHNLFDPMSNVVVGVAILAERMDWYDGDIAKALTAYNRGFYEGTITQYAKDILAKAEELRGTAYETSRRSAGSQS